MPLFRIPKFSSRDNLRDDASRPAARRINPRLDPLGRLFLPLGLDKDGRAILRANVIALLVACCRVMQAEKPIQEGFVREYAWVKLETNRLGMAAFSIMHILVGRLSQSSTRISDATGQDSRD